MLEAGVLLLSMQPKPLTLCYQLQLTQESFSPLHPLESPLKLSVPTENANEKGMAEQS